MAIHLSVEQNTGAWYELRTGIPTASGFENIIQPKKLEYSASAARYINHLIAERTVGHVVEFQSDAMAEGHRREPESRAAFTLTTGLKTEDGGFYLTNDYRAGCSPDARIVGGGLWEAKNPNAATHIGYDRSNGELLYSDYRIQVQTQLLISEQDYCKLMSYYPEMRDVIRHVDRDEEIISKIRDCMNRFCDELDAAWDAHKQKHGITTNAWDTFHESLKSGAWQPQ